MSTPKPERVLKEEALLAYGQRCSEVQTNGFAEVRRLRSIELVMEAFAAALDEARRCGACVNGKPASVCSDCMIETVEMSVREARLEQAERSCSIAQNGPYSDDTTLVYNLLVDERDRLRAKVAVEGGG